MKMITKVIIALLVGGLTSAIVGFVYGVVGFQCDLFLIFPFLVVGIITKAEQAVVEWLNIRMGPIVMIAGLVFGFTAYAAHLYGGYSMLEGQIQNEIRFDWRFMSLSEEEQAVILKESTDYFLQQEVGQTGLLGQFLFNTRAGISHIRVGEGVFGENSIIGWAIELFKCAVMVLGTGWSFLWIGARSPQVIADRAEQQELARRMRPFEKAMDEVAKRVWDRDGGRCAYCGSTTDTRIRFIDPSKVLTKETIEPDDMITLCKSCDDSR